MHITLYRSHLCPRCHLARKHLLEIVSQDADIEVEDVDVFAAPRRSWQDGVRMIPALKIKSQFLSGVLLSKAKIIDFIAQFKP